MDLQPKRYGGWGVKIHCSAYSLDTNPLRLVGFTTEMFSMKINWKLYTQSSNFTHSVANETLYTVLQIAPLCKVGQSHMRWKKHKTCPKHCIINSSK